MTSFARSSSLRFPTFFLCAIVASACSDRTPGGPPDYTPVETKLVRSKPNEDRAALVSTHFLYDLTQGGTTFSYNGNERIDYQVAFDPALSGLFVQDGLVSGVAAVPGTIMVYVRAVAGALEARDTFAIAVQASPVQVAVAHPDIHALVGTAISVDPTDGGTTFVDAHAAPLTISVTFLPANSGLRLEDGMIVGTPANAGVVTARVQAQSAFGSVAVDEFDIIVHRTDELAVVSPNGIRSARAGVPVAIDVSKDGALLNRAASSFVVTFEPAIPGLTSTGKMITGTPNAPGVTTVTVVAAAGESTARDVFPFVVFGPNVGAPALPTMLPAYGPPDIALPQHFITTVPVGDERNPTTAAGATLGRVLFYDRRLSVNDERSCASCHKQQFGFGDDERFATSLTGVPITRHSMALANNRFHSSGRLFWDERASSLEAAVLQPIQDPREMGLSLSQLVTKVSATSFYRPLFQSAFGTEHVTSERIAFALAQFIRSMVSANSRFDAAFVGGGTPDFARVYTEEELRGKEVFELANCGECHELNAQVSDMVHNNGLDAVIVDNGAGRGRFRAPSLRNVAVRGRYMHDGRFSSIEEVIDFYDSGVQMNPFLDAQLRAGAGPLKLGLNAFDKQALAAFLRTLTDSTFLSDWRFSNPFPE